MTTTQDFEGSDSRLASPELTARVLTVLARQNELLAALVNGGSPAVDAPWEVVAPASPAPAPQPVAVHATQEQPIPPATSDPAPPADRGPDRDTVRRTVVAVVCEKSGYGPEELDDSTELGPELGFDSLMLGNVVVALSHEFPRWDVRALVPNDLRTLSDLVDQIVLGTTGSPPDPDLAPAAPSPPPASPAPAEVVEDRAPIDQLAEVTEILHRLENPGIELSRPPYYIEHSGNIADQTVIDDESYVSFSTYNYLGLTGHPVVREAVVAAVQRYGTSVSAARILPGNRPIHTELEQALTNLTGAQDAVTLVGGHATNTSIVPHLYGKGDIVFYDSLVHDSIHQGMAASGAVRHAYPHNDMQALRAALTARRHQFRRALIVTEGLFSVDGGIPPLAELVALKREFGAHLMIDEAHSIGVLGSHGGGICDETGVDPDDVDILMGSLSKSLASCGGYVAGRRAFVDYLRYSLSGIVFSAGMTPANTVAALAASQVLAREPDRMVRMRDNATRFLHGARERGLDVGSAIGAAVVPVILGDSFLAARVADELFQRRFSVNQIVFPAVPEHLARLRFFITSEHTHAQLDAALDATAEIVAQIRSVAPADAAAPVR